MQEVLAYYMPRIKESGVLQSESLEQGKFFIVSAHREENVDAQENLQDLITTLHTLADEYQLPVVVSTHPRTRQRLEAFGESFAHPLVRFVKPYGFLDYVKLQMSAFCILSDSGTITEEASLLNLPAVTIRNTHERPEGMDEGVLVMSGLKTERVLESVKVVTSQYHNRDYVAPIVADYKGGAVSQQVVRIVLSYTDYINRTVWSK